MEEKSVYTTWKKLLLQIREVLDLRGLRHIAINNDNGDLYLTSGRLRKRFIMAPGSDMDFSFQPVDPDWRIYKLEGEPFEKWEIEARRSDFHDIPVISLSAQGKWEIRFGYAQGLLPPEVFDDEQTFLATLMDCLVGHFSDRVYTLRVWTGVGKGTENEITS